LGYDEKRGRHLDIRNKKGSFLNLKISWKIHGQHHLPPLRQNTPRGKGGDVGVPEGVPPLGEGYCILLYTKYPSPLRTIYMV